MNYWYLDRDFLRARTGQKNWYGGFSPDALGDGLFHSAIYAAIKNDDKIMMVCVRTINEGKRWPDCFNDPQMAQSWWEEIDDNSKYRRQNGMTRDPYVYVISSMNEMGCVWQERIKDIKIPWKTNRPDLKNWHKYLSTKELKYKKRYEFWASLQLWLTGWFLPAFALQLNYWKAHEADSDKMRLKLQKYVANWNLLGRILTRKNIDSHDFERLVNSYIAKTGYQWTKDKWNPPGIWNDERYWIDEETFIQGNTLRLDDKIKLDKDIIEYLFNLYIK